MENILVTLFCILAVSSSDVRAAEMQGDRQASSTNEPAKDNTVLSTTRYGMNK